MKWTFQNGIIVGALCAIAVFFVIGSLQRRALRRRAFGGMDLTSLLHPKFPMASTVHSKQVHIVGGADGKPRWEMREMQNGKETRKSGEGLNEMFKEMPEIGFVGQLMGGALLGQKALESNQAVDAPKIEELPSSCEPTTPVLAAP